MKAPLPPLTCSWLPLLVLGVTLPLAAAPSTAATATQRLSLNGTWRFTADYQNAGEAAQWFAPSYNDGVWDHVTVPHTWSHDPRFLGFVGAGWYRLRFTAPAVAPGRHVRLHFGAVFAQARVWLNGQPVGAHEGGYTPFSLDVGSALKPGAANLLVVCADNRWDTTTMPGARGGAQPPEQVYAWWDDGGIIRDVELQVLPAVHVLKQKVEALPDRAAGTAAVRLRTWLRNTSGRAERVGIATALSREGQALPVAPPATSVEVAPGGEAVAEQSVVLAADHVRLWQLDAPVLYEARTVAGDHAADPVTFGLRRFEIRGTQFLLNGHPIRLAGANWHASHTDWGQNQPAAGVIRDLQLMKEGGFVLQRFAHYPVSPVILDWADRQGLLIIAEAGNTGGTAEMLASEGRRGKFRVLHREMMERDWNHPSVIAWSVGNEFAADTPAGVRWVQDMVAFTRELDATRPVTFVSNTVAKPSLKTATDEGSAFADFVCLNTYGRTPRDNAANIDRAHALHPGKPLLVTEYGLRHDFVGDETERIDWFREMLALVRARPFVAGLSVWSLNDYRSRYVGTNPNGWREWGLVAPDRTPRGAYHALRREHGGFVLQEATLGGGKLTVRFAARTDFPLYPPAECELRVQFVDGQNRPVATSAAPLRTNTPIVLPLPAGASGYRLEIWRGGFRTATFGHALAP
jgi:beta-glucuronidase